MKMVFVSNYINHHQIPFCNELYHVLGDGFSFVQTEPMEEERISLGWNAQEMPPYVIYAYKEKELCREKILDSDIVIWGGVEDETMLKPRLDAGKPVFRYCERLYKTGQWKAVSPRGLKKKYYDHTKYRKKPVYLLCAGAFVASDFHIIKAYPDKKFKWGYFPECKKYEITDLMGKKQKKNGITEILWAARFIDWKHPELVVELVDLLAAARQDFHVTMIGGGELRDSTEAAVKEKGLEKYITMAGVKTPVQVREQMEEADIFMMTSDRQEGWGAVMNEAMNSGCAVIANRMEGAAPFLIQSGENGFLYTKEDAKHIAGYVNRLLDEKDLCRKMGIAAYKTIENQWNAQIAAQRLLKMCEDIMNGNEPKCRWESGPCSVAQVIKERQ